MVVFQKMKLFLLFTQGFLYFLNHVYCQECSKHMTFIENHIIYRRLYGFMLETWTGISLHDCARWCLSDRRCMSFNHREELNMCDLNNETAVNVDPIYMIEYELDTWHYFDISSWEDVYDLACGARSCPSSDRCMKANGASICYENPPRCPTGFLQFEHKCYLYTDLFEEWSVDMEYCNAINSTLFALRTWEENVYIIEIMKGLITTNALTTYVVWSGAKYTPTRDDYLFYPGLDAVNRSYATWPSWHDEDNHCIYVAYVPEIIGAWRTGHCTAMARFFCEKDLTI